MAIVDKKGGKLPAYMGDWSATYNEGHGYMVKNRVTIFGSELESLIDNNTYVPATRNEQTGVVTFEEHWKVISNGSQAYAAALATTNKMAELEEEWDDQDQRMTQMQATINAKQLEVGAVQTDEVPTENSGNHMTSGDIYQTLKNPNKGFVDNTHTFSATNLATSGAVASHGSAFDISEYNKNGDTLATYATLADALAAIPSSVKRGGMSVKFVQSSDNKYVQCRYMGTSTANADFINTDNWVNIEKIVNVLKQELTEEGVIPIELSIKGGISGVDGSDVVTPDYIRSEYIIVKEGQRIDYKLYAGSTGWATLACYDSESTYLSDISIKGASEGTFVIPSGVAKIRISSGINYAYTFAQIQLQLAEKSVKYPNLDKDITAYFNRNIRFSIDGGVGYASGDFAYGSQTERKITDYIKVYEGEKIKYNLIAGSAGWCAVAAFDANFAYVKSASVAGLAGITSVSDGIYVVPSGVEYLVFTGLSSYDNNVYFVVDKNLANEILDSSQGKIEFNVNGGLAFSDGSDVVTPDFIRTPFISVNTGDIVLFKVTAGSAAWGALCAYDSSYNYVQTASISTINASTPVAQKYIVPEGVHYIKISGAKAYEHFAYKNKTLKINDVGNVNITSLLKYTNLLKPKGCVAIQMDLGKIDNSYSGCQSMLSTLREYGLMSMDYAVNITSLNDENLEWLLTRQMEGCEIIYHNRVNTQSDVSSTSSLTVEEAKQGVTSERRQMLQKGMTTYGIVANNGSIGDQYKPMLDKIFFWEEYESAQIMTGGAENTKAQYLIDNRIVRTGFEISDTDYSQEVEAEMIQKGKDWIDDLCENKTMGVIYCHFYDVDTVDYHLYPNVLKAMCQYIVDKINDGELYFGSTTECLNYLCK